MQDERRSVSPWLTTAIVAVALWVVISRLVGSWPLDVHLRDDAYYYFAWARSLAGGEGPCVTPGVPTSGVHILWALLLTGLSAVFGSACLPVASVVLGLILHLGTAGIILAAARPLRGLGVAAAGAYLGSPFLVAEAMNGQETALACCTLALFCLLHQRSALVFFWTGLLCVAARSDLIFLVFVLALAVPRRRAARILAVAAIVLCYAGWNLVLAGSWLQDSATPMSWLMADELAASGGSRATRLWEHTAWLVTFVPFRLSSTPMALAWLLVAALGWRRREAGFAWLLAGGLLLILCHDLWRLYPRDYYFAPLGVLGGLALARLHQLVPRIGWVMLCLCLLWNGKHALAPQPAHNWQREMTMAGRFLHRFVPSGEAVGSFNCGLVTWYHDGEIRNLDGVVNAPAFHALRKHRLLEYLEQHGVHYLVDNPVQFAAHGTHANGRHFGGGFAAERDLHECVRFVWPGDSTPRGREGMAWFSLYRLRDSGRAPILPGTLRDLGPAPGGGRCVAWPARKGEILRTQSSTVFTAPETLVYVLQVPWPGVTSLQLFVGEDAEPVLEILPDRPR